MEELPIFVTGLGLGGWHSRALVKRTPAAVKIITVTPVVISCNSHQVTLSEMLYLSCGFTSTVWEADIQYNYCTGPKKYCVWMLFPNFMLARRFILGSQQLNMSDLQVST